MEAQVKARTLLLQLVQGQYISGVCTICFRVVTANVGHLHSGNVRSKNSFTFLAHRDWPSTTSDSEFTASRQTQKTKEADRFNGCIVTFLSSHMAAALQTRKGMPTCWSAILVSCVSSACHCSCNRSCDHHTPISHQTLTGPSSTKASIQSAANWLELATHMWRNAFGGTVTHATACLTILDPPSTFGNGGVCFELGHV